MAVEKGLVQAAIERRFAGKSLTKNFKDSIATKWAAKIDNDADIDGYIEDREDVILEASAEGDRRASGATKKPSETVTTTTIEEGTAGTVKTEMQQLLEAVGTLTAKVTSLETEKQKQTVSEKALTHEALKGVPKSFLKGRSIPDKVEEIDAWANEVKEDFTAFATEHKINTTPDDTPGFAGRRSAKGDTTVKAKAADDPKIKEVVGKINI